MSDASRETRSEGAENPLLIRSPFEAYFWECPPVNALTVDTLPYEHKTVENARGFYGASPFDFQEHLVRPRVRPLR